MHFNKRKIMHINKETLHTIFKKKILNWAFMSFLLNRKAFWIKACIVVFQKFNAHCCFDKKKKKNFTDKFSYKANIPINYHPRSHCLHPHKPNLPKKYIFKMKVCIKFRNFLFQGIKQILCFQKRQLVPVGFFPPTAF